MHVRELCSTSYEVKDSVPIMKAGTDERETINCCYGYKNAKGDFCALLLLLPLVPSLVKCLHLIATFFLSGN